MYTQPTVFDEEQLLETCWQDREFAQEVIQEFCHASSEILSTMEQAIQAGDSARLREAAHTLKGSGRTIGAEALSQACQILEVLGRQGNLSEAPAALEQARWEYKRLIGVLERVFGERAA